MSKSVEDKLEARLLRNQKLEAAAQLAGGVTHDLNNILGGVMMSAGALLEKLDASDPLRQEAELIHEGCNRAAAVVRKLLTASMHQAGSPRELNLNDFVAEMEPLFRQLSGPRIQLELQFRAEVALVRADSEQLEHVLLNLALNARDAMPDGGTLRFATESVGTEAGPSILLRVSDTGHGLSQESCERIFDPFYANQNGATAGGLGLSTAYGIIRRSRGQITVSSAPGKGTEFQVVLPCVRSALPARGLATRGTVLLVEDDEFVRERLSERLLRAGFNVLEASGGKQALQAARLHEGGIELVVTDLMMPDINGIELIRALEVTRPEIKTVFISGYPEDSEVFGGMKEGACFLQKPFTAEKLLSLVLELMPSPAPAQP